MENVPGGPNPAPSDIPPLPDDVVDAAPKNAPGKADDDGGADDDDDDDDDDDG